MAQLILRVGICGSPTSASSIPGSRSLPGLGTDQPDRHHPGHDHRHHGQRLGLGGGTPTTAQAGSTKPAFPVAIITGQNTTSPGEREPDHLPRTGQRPGLRQPTTDYAPVNQGFPLGGDTAIMLTIGETPIEPDVATEPDEAAGAARAWLATHGCS